MKEAVQAFASLSRLTFVRYAASCRVICFLRDLQIMPIRFASAAAVAAAVSMLAAPAAAVELPQYAPAQFAGYSAMTDSGAIRAQAHRRWRHRDRVDAGDVIAGVAVLGVIAAVASAASKSSRDRDYRYPQRFPYPERPYDYRSGGGDWRTDQSRGLDRAVDMCAREVERNTAIDTVDNVQRTATGWHVSGRLRDGAPFNCTIGNDGRIEGVDYGRLGAVEDRQWDDERYAAARRAQDGTQAPAYPGGPIGDEAGDDRYEIAQAPGTEG